MEDHRHETYMNDISYCDNFISFSSTLPQDFEGPCFSVNWVKYKGIKYSFRSTVELEQTNFMNENLHFLVKYIKLF